MNLNLSRRVFHLGIVRQRGHGLTRGRGGGVGVPVEHRHRRIQLVDRVEVAACGVERDVARTGTRRQLGAAIFEARQIAAIGREAIGENAIESEIGSEQITIVSAQDDSVRVRACLPLLVDA